MRFPVNFAKFLRATGLTEQPQVIASDKVTKR